MSNKNPSLINFNKTLILLFIVLGQVSDGIQTGDYFFFAATVLWIWLPTCVRLETTVINHVTHATHDQDKQDRPMAVKHRVNVSETSIH